MTLDKKVVRGDKANGSRGARAPRPAAAFDRERFAGEPDFANENKERAIGDRHYMNPGALTAPIPPAMVTVGDMEDANVLTVAWTGILATVPPKTYISVRPSRHSHGMLKENGEFVINLPSASLAKTVDFVGIYTGKKMDKFEKCGIHKVESKRVEPPTIAECPLAPECRVTEMLRMGSHDVFIADIVSVSAKSELIDNNGKLCLDRANLLAYAHGEYFPLGAKLGRFGFSTDKKKNARSGAEKKGGEAAEAKEIGSSDGRATELSEARYEKRSDSRGKNRSEEKTPFYKGMPKGKKKTDSKENKDKGKPHGKRKKA